jgi:hypothetical protein
MLGYFLFYKYFINCSLYNRICLEGIGLELVTFRLNTKLVTLTL